MRAAAHRHQAGEPLRGDRVGGGCDARVEAARVQLDGRIACDEAALARVRGVPGWSYGYGYRARARVKVKARARLGLGLRLGLTIPSGRRRSRRRAASSAGKAG